MSKTLSHSGKLKYLTCGDLYKKHYIEGYRPRVISSALLYGSAIDKALEDLHNTGLVPHDTLIDQFDNMLNRTDIRFFKIDCNGDTELEARLKRFDSDPEGEKMITNNLIVEALRWKALIHIDQYIADILPRIRKVHSLQGEIEHVRDNYTINGKLDIDIVWDDGLRYTADFKTSSAPYKDDSVETSQQLAIYDSAHGKNGRGMYIVFLKKVSFHNICRQCKTKSLNNRAKSCQQIVDAKGGGIRRCKGDFFKVPFVPPIQIVTGKISDSFITEVVHSFDSAAEGIRKGVFVKNLNACENQYGRRCDMYELCKNNDSKDVIKLEDK